MGVTGSHVLFKGIDWVIRSDWLLLLACRSLGHSEIRLWLTVITKVSRLETRLHIWLHSTTQHSLWPGEMTENSRMLSLWTHITEMAKWVFEPSTSGWRVISKAKPLRNCRSVSLWIYGISRLAFTKRGLNKRLLIERSPLLHERPMTSSIIKVQPMYWPRLWVGRATTIFPILLIAERPIPPLITNAPNILNVMEKQRHVLGPHLIFQHSSLVGIHDVTPSNNGFNWPLLMFKGNRSNPRIKVQIIVVILVNIGRQWKFNIFVLPYRLIDFLIYLIS